MHAISTNFFLVALLPNALGKISETNPLTGMLFVVMISLRNIVLEHTSALDHGAM